MSQLQVGDLKYTPEIWLRYVAADRIKCSVGRSRFACGLQEWCDVGFVYGSRVQTVQTRHLPHPKKVRHEGWLCVT